jgi:hypothetical protein
VLSQRVKESVLRHRRGNQHALTEIAAHHHQGLQVGNAFDASRDCHAAESMGEINCGLANCCVGNIDSAILDE